MEITGTTHDGDGVGRIENIPVFVPGSARGDLIRVRITAVRKSYAYGRMMKVLRPSPARIEVDCPVFLPCGGCAFRHIAYAEELEVKRQRVRDALAKIGGLVLEPEPVEGSDRIEGYRNKAQIPVRNIGGEIRIGYYARHSHRIVEYPGCRLQPPVFEKVLGAFRGWIGRSGVTAYEESDASGLLRHIYIRQAGGTGELMACAVINGDTVPQPELLVNALRDAGADSILLNINRSRGNAILGSRCVTLWGKDRITDILCGKRFEISPLSFYQVNRRQAEKLYAAAAEMAQLTGSEQVLDLYCGAGTIGLTLADRASWVTGVEIVPEAVEDARANAALNGIVNADFLCADAETAASGLPERGRMPDVVIVDPPRKGLTGGTIDSILRMNPRRIIYVSCDPATLARDLAAFDAGGYRCVRVRPFDMFPRTPHVECCALLEEKS